jgi:hypothetical protein
MPLEEYELTTKTQHFAVEKEMKTKQRWSKLCLDVYHVCDGCNLKKCAG